MPYAPWMDQYNVMTDCALCIGISRKNVIIRGIAKIYGSEGAFVCKLLAVLLPTVHQLLYSGELWNGSF